MNLFQKYCSKNKRFWKIIEFLYKSSLLSSMWWRNLYFCSEISCTASPSNKLSSPSEAHLTPQSSIEIVFLWQLEYVLGVFSLLQFFHNISKSLYPLSITQILRLHNFLNIPHWGQKYFHNYSSILNSIKRSFHFNNPFVVHIVKDLHSGNFFCSEYDSRVFVSFHDEYEVQI